MAALVVLNLSILQGYWMVWAAGLVASIGLLNAAGVKGEKHSTSSKISSNPSSKDLLVAASALTLATLPWYLDRSFFWANHAHFHMDWLSGLSLLTPILAILMFWTMNKWTTRGRDTLETKLTTSRPIKALIASLRLPASFLVLLVGLAGYLAASAVDWWFVSGPLLLLAEVCWLSAAWLALRQKPFELSPGDGELADTDPEPTGTTAAFDANRTGAPVDTDNPELEPSTAHSSPASSDSADGADPAEAPVLLATSAPIKPPASAPIRPPASQATPPSFFLKVLALQAALALWLTMPPVFYAAFAWPGMPVWVNHLLYHTPLALAIVGLVALLAAIGRRAILDVRARAAKAGASN